MPFMGREHSDDVAFTTVAQLGSLPGEQVLLPREHVNWCREPQPHALATAAPQVVRWLKEAGVAKLGELQVGAEHLLPLPLPPTG